MAALSGIRVLDFGRYIAGPYCATLLADFGADVIRVERRQGGEDRGIAPVTEEGEGSIFLQVNRNKRSLTLDPRAPGADTVIRRLVASADVVVANVPTSALAAMGINYPTLAAIRPDIILANASSFGPSGPWSERPGFDSVGQAMCGSAFLSGPGDHPYRTPISWVDHSTALYTAFGVMVALFERQTSKRGQEIDTSLLGSALAFSSTYLIEQALTGLDRTAIGNRSFINGPTDAFRTKDGWIVVQVVSQPIFRRWAALMAEPEWLEDPRFATDELRGDNGAILSERMSRWCGERGSEEALETLGRAGVPAGPVLSPQQALDHPQVQAMGIVEPMVVRGLDRPAPLLRPPVNLHATPATIDRAPPSIGEHSDEILSELGFDAAAIAGLRTSGAI